MPTKLFVSGSRSIKELPLVVRSYLDRFMSQGVIFLVGDCEGVDALVQKYLYDSRYDKVIAYTSGKSPRHFHGSIEWEIVHLNIDPTEYLGKEYHRQKDIRMSYDCTRGFAIWDGKSRATHYNVNRLRNMGKECTVFRTDWKENL
jgi:adenine-specific DNA-methyltransferase